MHEMRDVWSDYPKTGMEGEVSRPTHNWEVNTEVRCDIMDWILVAQNRDQLWSFVSMVMNLEVLCKVEFLEYVSDY